VLAIVAKHGKIKAINIATELGITERSVRRIIADLISEDYISIEKEGRNNTYMINYDLPLRRKEMYRIKIEDLLKAFLSERKS
jgi:predicted transcriptional regulator